MSKTKTGGPAFCVPSELCQDLTIEQQRGMTLRDYFAAKAMQGFAANLGPGASYISRAITAYEWADAMLIAREK